MVKKRGQSGMEVMLIIALILIISLPFLGGFLANLNSRMNLEDRIQVAVEVADLIETTANLGYGNYVRYNTDYRMEIRDNELFVIGKNGEDDVSVIITPTVPNGVLEDGAIQIINGQNRGITIENGEEIDYLDPAKVSYDDLEDGIEIIINGDYFTNESRVNFNQEEVSPTSKSFFNKNKISFKAKTSIRPCGCEVYLVREIDGVDSYSNVVKLEVD
ncbi:MAG: hypothetical protein Q8Q42_03200 [Nanoarchaeota archaeon]|nr:hypothetical protein [Nanoarchaeota archaeon]